MDELVEHWTLLKDEQELVSGKRGATRLGFAMLLKFYTQYGRFPRGRSELPGEAVEFVSRQVQVLASELGLYDWTGRTVEYHRAQIRKHLGFRECSVADAEKLTAHLAEHAARKERRPPPQHHRPLPVPLGFLPWPSPPRHSSELARTVRWAGRVIARPQGPPRRRVARPACGPSG
ncbi:DUF4158 domain-containing protein [Streptomyces mirabilis]|uniref:DUF4158 domain-containing protein n=1 Tax=Streptomyces mirabilis TaxID=68239 RepID=UPI003644E9D6